MKKQAYEQDQQMEEIILHNKRNQNPSLQLLLLALALIVCVFLALVVNVHYGIDVVYTHLFYIPIVMAGVWYHRWALLIAGGLGAVHISCDYVVNHGLTSSSLLRTGMFLGIALVVWLLSEKRDLLYQELQKINNVIKETEIKYKTVAEYAYDWETWEDETGQLKYISLACERTSGYTVNEFSENKTLFASLILEEDQARWANHRHDIEFDKGLHSEQFRIRNKNGKIVWIEHICRPVIDKNGMFLGYRANNRDITDRKQAEEQLLKNEERYRTIFENTGTVMLVIEEDITISLANTEAEKLFGYSKEELEGMKKWSDFITKEDLERMEEYHRLRRIDPAGAPKVYEFNLINKQGAVRNVSMFVAIIPGTKKSVVSLLDITERKKAQDALKLSEEKYSNYIENAPDGVFVIDEKGHFIEVNRASTKMTGYSKDELLQMTISDLLTEESQEAGMNHFNNLLKKGSAIGSLQHKHKDGTKIWLTIDAVKLTEHCFLGFAKDITYQKKIEEQILYISYHDQLTGLYNRRFYEEELKRLDTKRNLPLTIVMGDVNGLKLINDSFGHAMGDELLRKAAEVIKNACRDDDIIARLGGDEFVIILPKTDAFETEQIIKRIKDLSLKEKVGNIDISISFGYAAKSNEEENIQEIFKYAEDLMYQHKRKQ